MGTPADDRSPNTARLLSFIWISMAPWGHASLQEPQPLHLSSFTSGSTRSSSLSRSISPRAPRISLGSHRPALGCLMKPTWYLFLPHLVGDHLSWGSDL